MFRFLSLSLALLMLAACAQPPGSSDGAAAADPMDRYDGGRIGHFGFGEPAGAQQIAGWDIDIRPDGAGLPDGAGSVEDGEWIYEEQCAECHGSFGEGVGRFPVLAGGQGTLRDARPNRTVGSYWPYTSTLFDYIRRTMPFTQPQSLSDEDTYAVTAYVLYLNDLVADDFVLTRDNFTSVRLPNEGNFVPDPRPDVANVRCMADCRDPDAIEILSEVAGTAVQVAQSGAEEPVAATEAAAHPGEATYRQYCSICHDVGVAGAPKIGSAADWEERLSGGTEALIANAINGVSSPEGVMPPKGGFTQLADEEVGAAVEFMVEASR